MGWALRAKRITVFLLHHVTCLSSVDGHIGCSEMTVQVKQNLSFEAGPVFPVLISLGREVWDANS